MKNKGLLIFALTPILLTSCNKTSELYKGNAYDTGNFETNYYLEHNNVDKIKISKTTELDEVNQSFVYVSNPGYEKYLDGISEEDQKYDGKKLEWQIDTPIEDFGTGYGPTMNLSSIDESFKKGFLSRLYDGRVRCDGYYAQSRLQLNKTGYSTFFPKELISGKYFEIALRGQTSTYGFDFAKSSVNLNLTLYKHFNNSDSEYEAIKVYFKNVTVPTNTHGDASLMVCRFDDMFFKDGQKLDYSTYLNGVVGMTLTFSLNEIIGCEEDKTLYGTPCDDKDDKNNPHYSLMLYELLMPFSSWR